MCLSLKDTAGLPIGGIRVYNVFNVKIIQCFVSCYCILNVLHGHIDLPSVVQVRKEWFGKGEDLAETCVKMHFRQFSRRWVPCHIEQIIWFFSDGMIGNDKALVKNARCGFVSTEMPA